jgi:hypothetical protein
MRASSFDFLSNLDTVFAVLVGAVLATSGALIAEIIQDRLGRKRRQRDAARFFGEIITSVGQILDLACESQKIGDRWGSYSVRLFEIAAREASIYDRNRERLFDLHDMALRFAIHGYMLRTTVPIESVIEQSRDIDSLRTKLGEDASLTDAARSALSARIEKMEASREGGIDGATAERAVSADILKQLEALAGTRFEARY